MRGVNSWEEKRHVREGSTEEMTGEAHGHVGEAKAVEYARVRILELGEVDVLLDVLVLGAQLREAALVVHRVVVRGREEAVRRPRRGCIGASGRSVLSNE